MISDVDLVENDTYIAEKALNNVNSFFRYVPVGGVNERPCQVNDLSGSPGDVTWGSQIYRIFGVLGEFVVFS